MIHVVIDSEWRRIQMRYKKEYLKKIPKHDQRQNIDIGQVLCEQSRQEVVKVLDYWSEVSHQATSAGPLNNSLYPCLLSCINEIKIICVCQMLWM